MHELFLHHRAWVQQLGGHTATGADPTYAPFGDATRLVSPLSAYSHGLMETVGCCRPYAPISCPAHPTFDLLSLLQTALDEDAGGHGDLTSLATCKHLPILRATDCLLQCKKLRLPSSPVLRAGCRPQHQQAQHSWQRPMVLSLDLSSQSW